MENMKKALVGLMVFFVMFFSCNIQVSQAADTGKYLKYAVIGAGVLVVGGVGLVFAAPIAAAVGATGVLGAASTGTAITTLSGVAAENASLAALGGGALSAGGAGIAGGTVVVTGTAGIVGGAAAAGANEVAAKIIADDDDG